MDQLQEAGESPVTEEQGKSMANKIRAVKYLECSALTQVLSRSLLTRKLVSFDRFVTSLSPSHPQALKPKASVVS